jgi:hypothetical protein
VYAIAAIGRGNKPRRALHIESLIHDLGLVPRRGAHDVRDHGSTI